ncbi:AAA family ATPase [Desulfobacca acetoxidans]|uniref:ATPase associated with various cellular activities AAA_5 n=1 Tax=Desulfobacca acetoxidans (strain ATCC 700848 / DSM 11109 / ASRB2) TaxID=880072 RepID=F2NGY5_DESAR|nr:AAA family ATPase [Desulfobacca acetoxidans]AEB08756.1 ATPase associated with various cellular activities AAA_5 [Desulfobacca acetoxidans DSM 11109]
MILSERLARELREVHQKLDAAGELLSKSQLDEYYAVFRQKFGPEVISRWEGEELLEKLHDHSNRDSLVYWLEFKNDEEFTAHFGSIAGGSALKFGIYRRRETGAWTTGSPRSQRELSLDEAITIARKHRDQLLAGVGLLEKLPAFATDAEYATLQDDMNRLAHPVNDTAWGHKYFSLLFPEKLDDFHVPSYQRFHLIKLLQKPAADMGRYTCAGQYERIARELNFPINHLTSVLNARNGRPYRYWRIGTRLDPQGSIWELMQDQSCVAVGWLEIGALADIEYNQASKEKIRTLLNTHYPGRDPRAQGRDAQQIFNFVAGLGEGDIVVASDGMRVLGLGRITGPYVFESQTDAPHRHPVEWLWHGEYSSPVQEGLRTTVYELKKSENLIEIESRFLGPLVPPPRPYPRPSPLILAGIPGRIQDILERKGQVILYGPPGTGKTYWAVKTTLTLASFASFGATYDQLTDGQRKSIHDDIVRMCTFHPAYGYEDFWEGYRPQAINGSLAFELQDGIFKKLCEDARNQSDRKFYLIIDEINRGDIPRIFGELLTVLEKDKRGKTIFLPLSRQPFTVPNNVFVIGTMNTADRSIALLDKALRRRFGFVELMPDSSVLEGALVADIPLGPWLNALNQRLCEHIGRDARNLQIGHSYLLDQGRAVSSFTLFTRILQDDIIPLIEEYCYEDFSTLAKILGAGLVDEQQQRIRHELFEPTRRDELIQALLSPEVVTSMEATAAETPSDTETGDRDEDDSVEGTPE